MKKMRLKPEDVAAIESGEDLSFLPTHQTDEVENVKRLFAGFGKPRKYTPKTLLGAFERYVEWAKNNPLYVQQTNTKAGVTDVKKRRPLTIVGFCCYAEIVQDTFENYAQQEPYFRVCSYIRAYVHRQKFEGASVGEFNHSIVARALGLADNQKIEVSAEVVSGVMFEPKDSKL